MEKPWLTPRPGSRFAIVFWCLPAEEYARLAPHLTPVPLEFNQSIYEFGAAIDYAYFPTRGVISAVATTEDGDAIEIATVGNEGMTGLPALIEPESSPSRLFVQVPGAAMRIPAEALRREIQHEARCAEFCTVTRSRSWCNSRNRSPATACTRSSSAAVVGY